MFDRQAFRELARNRVDRLVSRICFYLLGAAIGAVFVPAGWVALCLGLIAIPVFAEHRAARTLLAAEPPEHGAADPPGAKFFAASHVAASIAVAFAIGTIWVFTGPDAKVLPLSLLSIAVLDTALTGHQVLRLMMARQALFLGTAIVLTMRDIRLGDGATPHALGAELLPVLLLAAAVLSASRFRARAYRDQIRREYRLAEANDVAERANARKSGFVATISHELRTQLNGVLGMAQNLLAGKLTPEQRRQAEVIAESGHSLNALLDDILDFARLEAGKLSIDPVEDDLRAAIDHVARLYGPLAASKGLELAVAVGPDIPRRLVFDPVRVRQCLSNLVANAIKFTETGSVHLAVSAEPHGPAPDGTPRHRVAVVVTDTGIGIPAAHQARLFQPFSQADDTVSRKFGGTGLGLSITRQLAESMGGSVALESAPGKGSTFRLTFAAGGVPDGGRELSGGEAPSILAKLRVLVADDVESSRMVMRLFLQPLGVDVVEAADGPAALDALTGPRLDAAVLDLNMPGMGGAEVARRVRAGTAGRRDLPLLAVSADSAVSGDDASASGFDAIIVKPVDLHRLRSALADAIRHRAGDPSPPAGTRTSTGGRDGG